MATKKKESAGSFIVTIIFILSIVVLVLIFVLFTRDQGTKAVENTLSDLAKTNAELLQEQKTEKQKSIDKRLEEAGFDPNNLWQLTPCENMPYCTFLKTGTGEGDSSAIHAVERWSGYHETYDDGETTCDQFVLNDGFGLPINLEMLASVEQNILKDSTPKDPIEITVYRSEDRKRDPKSSQDLCAMPAYVLNVHLE